MANTRGGLLVYGVSDRIELAGIDLSSVDEKQLLSTVRNGHPALHLRRQLPAAAASGPKRAGRAGRGRPAQRDGSPLPVRVGAEGQGPGHLQRPAPDQRRPSIRSPAPTRSGSPARRPPTRSCRHAWTS
ncbi:hypothetical protein [Streptomyces violaceus]|uniref:hypothetical protein n=1 Tax=Streptomyces violaceus TaxID=1936 RepID=UPI00399D771B